jgi:hypothetical protein
MGRLDTSTSTIVVITATDRPRPDRLYCPACFGSGNRTTAHDLGAALFPYKIAPHPIALR